MKTVTYELCMATLTAALTFATGSVYASSHMDAPLITLDDAANTTDVYAFVSQNEASDIQYLTTALAVYPFEEPGIGPNNYRFDDNVRYEIHVALGDDVAKGEPTISYRFLFDTEFKNQNTVLQSYLGVLEGMQDPEDDRFDINQNLRQTYTITQIDHRTGEKSVLGTGIVPPNNQGLVTPLYNQGDDGENPAKTGVASEADLDFYTQQAITELADGHRSFAGQRDDGFYADIQSIFDLDFTFAGDNKPFDSQGGFNVHTLVLQIPLSEFEDVSQAGVYATTSRRQFTVLSSKPKKKDDTIVGKFVQVGRQGNPLFNEALVAIADKDLYNRTKPSKDDRLFKRYALEPELATVLRLANMDRGDIAGIFIPDVIKVDLTTGPARLAGDPDDDGFHRLSVFGDDTLTNANGEQVAGGWPNGRRFGDDVVDITVLALAQSPVDPTANVDRVTTNDITYNRVMPYAATPLNGRNHGHH